MRSYEYCVGMDTFEDELDVLISTIRMMPCYILGDGRTQYVIENETTEGENFADRWNLEPQRAKAFYAWHEKALAGFQAIRDAQGLDSVIISAKSQFGDKVIGRVMDVRNERLSLARKSDSLFIAPTIGLTTIPAATAIAVPKNDFFGD